MRAAVLREYGPAGSTLHIESDYPEPTPGPGQVLVHVRASSVNPIDVRISGGYGRNALKARAGLEPPLILGRDVVGTVRSLGAGVDRLAPGEEVLGMITAFQPGAFAELARVPAELLISKPPSLPWQQAASFPYVALTVWSALVHDAGVQPGGLAGRFVLVLGGSGGTGSVAVQLLKAWGAKVAATCSTRNVAFVASLGADLVVDYTRDDFTRVVRDADLVLDTVGDDEDRALGVLRSGADAHYVTIVHPIMPITDEMGWEKGILHAQALQQAKAEWQRAQFGRFYHWTMIKPDPAALASVTAMLAEGKIRMSVEQVFKLDRLRDAFARSATHHVRGKLVVDMAG